MPRDLGHFHVWENCYHSTYGKETALRYAERTYCQAGELYYTHNGRKVSDDSPRCPDWHKCKGLDSVLRKKKKCG